MAVPALRQAATGISKNASVGWCSASKTFSLAKKLEEYQEGDARPRLGQFEAERAVGHERVKSFGLHLGANLQVPTDDKRKTHVVDAPRGELTPQADPFEGVPLKAWAERMGERIMPTYEVIKEEQKRAKQAAKAAAPVEVAVPAIPHLLPFTRWASRSQEFKNTFIADDPKTRKKARLSWYHPDDTMVPRNWFRGGLLEDLKYYAPFSRSSASAESRAVST